MTDKLEEANRLVEIAGRCAKAVDAENPNRVWPTSASMLLLAYHQALQSEAAGYEDRPGIDLARVAYAKRICADAGQKPDLLVTQSPTIISEVLGWKLNCPVFDYRPMPLWIFLYRKLPDVPPDPA